MQSRAWKTVTPPLLLPELVQGLPLCSGEGFYIPGGVWVFFLFPPFFFSLFIFGRGWAERAGLGAGTTGFYFQLQHPALPLLRDPRVSQRLPASPDPCPSSTPHRHRHPGPLKRHWPDTITQPHVGGPWSGGGTRGRTALSLHAQTKREAAWDLGSHQTRRSPWSLSIFWGSSKEQL